MGFKINALSEIINTTNQEGASLNIIREAFSNFRCSKNLDEEDFFKNKAIDYEIQNKARTYLLLNENDLIAGYFSLAFKSIDLQNLSTTQKKKLTAGESDVTTYSAYLIGHIAKDDNIKDSIGDTILEAAENLLLSAQKIVGGRLIYLDCKNEPKLKNLYERNNYRYFKTSQQSGLLQYYKKL